MNFDSVAYYYDQLAGIVFGKFIKKSQVHHFGRIKRNSKVLIVGGGTGWILNDLPGHCSQVCYVELSGRMISRARSMAVSIPVDFIQTTIEEAGLTNNFDVIITNFFLDLYEKEKLSNVTRILKSRLKDDGIWIVTDFVNTGKPWQIFLLKVMYSFFKMTTGLRSRQLPDWMDVMGSNGMQPLVSGSYYHGFIKSVCYKLPSPV